MICLGTRVVVLCLLSVHKIAELSSFLTLKVCAPLIQVYVFPVYIPLSISLSVYLSIYQYKSVYMCVCMCVYTHRDVDILAYENIKLKANRMSMKNKRNQLQTLNTSYSRSGTNYRHLGTLSDYHRLHF